MSLSPEEKQHIREEEEERNRVRQEIQGKKSQSVFSGCGSTILIVAVVFFVALIFGVDDKKPKITNTSPSTQEKSEAIAHDKIASQDSVKPSTVKPQNVDDEVKEQDDIDKPSTLEKKKSEKLRAKPSEISDSSSQVAFSSIPTNVQVLKREMLNDALIISVSTENFDDAKEIARQFVEENKDEYMVRIFFYQPGHKPSIDMPVIRYEWTQAQGLIKSFDMRTPTPNSQHSSDLPSYEVLYSMRLLSNGRIYGEVLMESLSRKTPVEIRENLSRKIAIQEKLDDLDLFNSREAYQANNSASYLKDHPNALRKGFLGSFKEGKFMAGEDVFP